MHVWRMYQERQGMATVSIFLSHSRQDTAFCGALVSALRAVGADVWYDEHHLGVESLRPVVLQELDRGPICIVALSHASLASQSFQREATWAYELAKRDPTHLILPVTAERVDRGD